MNDDGESHSHSHSQSPGRFHELQTRDGVIEREGGASDISTSRLIGDRCRAQCVLYPNEKEWSMIIALEESGLGVPTVVSCVTGGASYSPFPRFCPVI